MNEPANKTKVVIFTNSFKITGTISNFSDTRLTDYITEPKPFIAVTNAIIEDHFGHNITKTSFISVQKNMVEIIYPADQIA